MKYNHNQLVKLIREYQRTYINPTRGTLAKWLRVSQTTIVNILMGTYNGKVYGKKPHTSRIISNGDMKIIRELFKK